MKTPSLTTLLITAAALSCSVSNAAIIQFDLLGRSGSGMRFDNENPTSASTATGGEVGPGITFDDASKVLTLFVGWGAGFGFSNLTGAVTAAHIHSSSGFTTNGGVVFGIDGATPGFNPSPTAGGWTNTQVTLSVPQEASLFAGQLYLNAHTAANGGGEIRGNLVQAVPEPTSLGLMAVGALGLLARRKRRAA